MPEASIIVTIEGTYASQIKSMANATKAFSKDVEGLESKLRYLDKSQDKLSSSITKSKKVIGELQKEFDKTGDAAVGLKLETERFNLHTMDRELELTRKEARETKQEIRDMTNETKRAKGLGGMFSGLKDSMETHGKSQLLQMVGQSAQQMLDAGIASAYGDDEGSLISSIISNAITGFSLGMYTGHPIVGTIIGAGVGLVNGATKNFTKRDDYFKAYYNGIIDEQAQQRTSDIQMGSSIAAGRETDLISFSRLFKSRGMAERYLDDLVSMANTTPFLYGDLTAMSKTLAAYGYGAADILPTLTKIGDAGAALGMGTDDMTMVATARGGFLLILR